ncbi:MAG: hypothetical protein I3273_02350 [Candidatus Moeniiplasma glomeromycotorum]|nr:hypothetical protein [Candidatus Moeniiplasma glomeromycotorum]MCE8167042.1 hypothetical protein [Candidatus Moeniiplasma glomeromycotorum]MCE8168946.1 hypothetical protein [Candidatus Moeniiplasma glomeromycotorum]
MLPILKEILNFFTDKLVLLLIFLTGLVVAGSIFGYNWWDKRQKQKQFEEIRREIYNVQNKRPEREGVSKHDDAHGWILTNHQQAKKIAEKIAQNPEKFGKWKPDLEKVRSELKTIEDLRIAGRENPEEVEKIFLKAYQQSISLGILSHQVTSNKEIKDQLEEQKKWLADEEARQAEQAEAVPKVDKLISHFYDRFMEQFSSEEKADWNIDPLMINGKPADPANRHADVNYIVSLNHSFTDRESQKIYQVQREKLNWKGFQGFFAQEEVSSSKEGMHTMGYTDRPGGAWNSDLNGTQFKFAPSGDLFIKLKKELLFNRQNRYYDGWITDFKETEDGRITYHHLNISEENFLNTAAHEIAHAVIESIRVGYNASEGGHGTLHDEYTDQIEEMIKKDKEYEKFLSWWREPQTKNG